jgi:cell division protein FtsL
MNQEIKNLESEIAEKESQLERLKEEHIQKLNKSKDYKDYTGGSNGFLNLENRERFLQGLKSVLNE